MFGLTLLALSALALAYLAWRTAALPWLARRWPKPRVWAVFGGLWLLIAAGRLLGRGTPFPGTAALEVLGMTLLGTLFLCTTLLLAADLATGFGLWAGRRGPGIRAWALLAGLLLSGAASIQGHRAPEVVDYEVALPGLPPARDGLRVVALSDLHLGATLGPAWLEARLAQVQALDPDLILFLGDVFEGRHRQDLRLIRRLRTLRAPFGVWAVEGNHDRHGPGASPWEASGLRLLRDGFAEPLPGLVLAGRAEPGRRAGSARRPWAVPAARPPGALVLLSHRPDDLETAARSGVGLMLAGHTHAGQIWPFGHLVERTYPVLAGRAQVGEMTLIVSRGTGTWGPRMRLWRRGEISRIRLRSGPPDSAPSGS